MASLNILCSEKKLLKELGKKHIQKFLVAHQKFLKIFYGPSMYV